MTFEKGVDDSYMKYSVMNSKAPRLHKFIGTNAPDILYDVDSHATAKATLTSSVRHSRINYASPFKSRSVNHPIAGLRVPSVRMFSTSPDMGESQA